MLWGWADPVLGIILQILNVLHNNIRKIVLKSKMFIKIKKENDFYLIKRERINNIQTLIQVVQKRWNGTLPNCYTFSWHDHQIMVGNQQQLDQFKLKQQPFENLLVKKCQNSVLLNQIITNCRLKLAQQRQKKQKLQKKMVKIKSNQKQQLQRQKESFPQQKQVKDTNKKQSAINQQKQESNSIISCKVCQKNIIGIRFKCKVCSNYNLCQKCQGVAIHYHRFDCIIPIQQQKQQKDKNQQIINEGLHQINDKQKQQEEQNQQQQAKNEEENEEEQSVYQVKTDKKRQQGQYQKAKMLSIIIEVPIQQCFDFIQKFPYFSVEQIVNLYYICKQKNQKT